MILLLFTISRAAASLAFSQSIQTTCAALSMPSQAVSSTGKGYVMEAAYLSQDISFLLPERASLPGSKGRERKSPQKELYRSAQGLTSHQTLELP